MKKLIQIAFPRFICPQTGLIVVLSLCLLLRTWLSIRLTDIQGKVVKSIVQKSLPKFTKNLSALFLLAVPSSTVNSALDYLNLKQALLFRRELVNYFNKKYLRNIIYYQMT